jgi:hypothetical protein
MVLYIITCSFSKEPFEIRMLELLVQILVKMAEAICLGDLRKQVFDSFDKALL